MPVLFKKPITTNVVEKPENFARTSVPTVY